MKHYILIIGLLFSLCKEINAQNKAIDTTWINLAEVSVVDDGLLKSLSSVVSSYLKLNNCLFDCWLLYLSTDSLYTSGYELSILITPSSFDSKELKNVNNFFYHNKELFFITFQDTASNTYFDDVFRYTNHKKRFYHLSIDWDLLEKSNMNKKKKSNLISKYGPCFSDYHYEILVRKNKGDWFLNTSIYLF